MEGTWLFATYVSVFFYILDIFCIYKNELRKLSSDRSFREITGNEN